MLKTVDVHVRHLRSVAVLDLSGDVTGQASEDLASAYDQATRLEPDAVLLDFTDVEYINSTGIAVLVTLLARARKEGGRMAACGLPVRGVGAPAVDRAGTVAPVVPPAAAQAALDTGRAGRLGAARCVGATVIVHLELRRVLAPGAARAAQGQHLLLTQPGKPLKLPAQGFRRVDRTAAAASFARPRRAAVARRRQLHVRVHDARIVHHLDPRVLAARGSRIRAPDDQCA